MTQLIVQKGIVANGNWIEQGNLLRQQCAIVTDTTVEKLYGKRLQKQLEEKGFKAHLFVIAPGEKSKTRAEKERIEDEMCAQNFQRDSTLIALGGGVVTDLAGFVAATYCRGISYISIPTTLLGMVDAAIGGKVAVNTPYGKNWIGAFYPPKAIVIDTAFLATLAPEELLNGEAEILKYAFILEPQLLDLALEKRIEMCIQLKQDIVQKDPLESGLRRVLNFGHTFGHALEKVSEYTISHGRAVAMGMIVESALSKKLGFLTEKENSDVASAISKRGFSFQLPKTSKKELWELMHHDKKAAGGNPRFVLLEKIGKVMSFDGKYCTSLDYSLLSDVMDEYGLP